MKNPDIVSNFRAELEAIICYLCYFCILATQRFGY